MSHYFYLVISTRTILFTFLILLVGIIPLRAQQKPDTTKPNPPLKIVAFDEDNLDFGNTTIQDSIHYSLDSFQVVHPFYINTGNLGSPGHDLIPHYARREAFEVRPDAFAYFGFNRYNRTFYHTNDPYTLLQYFIGQKHEQYVDVMHTRNFGDNLNFSFHFQRIRSEGFYLRQNTNNTSVRTNLWYKSPGKHYSFMTDIFWTGASVAENGGIVRDSSFEFSKQLDRQQNSVNLSAAATTVRKRDIWMKHTFALGKVTDTLVLDSTRSYHVITPAWGISIVSELYDEKYNYDDADPKSGFYDVIYRDSLETNDSTYCWRVNNSLRLERFNQYGAKKLRGYVGGRHEAGEYFNDTIYTHFNNVYADGFLKFDFGRMVQLFCGKSRRALQNSAEVKGWYIISGLNKGDYNGEVKCYFPTMLGGITLQAYNRSLTPQYVFMHYSSNHFKWQNDFAGTSETGAEAHVFYCGQSGITSVNLLLRWNSAINGLYFDDLFTPHQFTNRINTSSAGLSFNTRFGWFRSATTFVFSHTSNETIIRMPELFVEHSMYADVQLFKSAMQFQAGIDFTWFSSFSGEAYMPAIAQFYLQSDRTVGNYAYFSPWVSFRIKPVRVFVKAEHVNAGWMGRNYFLLAHYPHNDLALKIGVSWLFND